MELLKTPYQISLWTDEAFYVIQHKNGSREECAVLPLSGEYDIVNQGRREVPLGVIGTNTSQTPIRALNPKLTRNVNGSNTLTFQMARSYWDEDEEKMLANPFISLMINERKIKLLYDNEWLDFVIKQIDEDSAAKMTTYTCTDLYINELSKTGYDVELSMDLENNMGSVKELGTKVLDGSDWYINEKDCDLIKQYNIEPLYGYLLDKDIVATVMENFEYGDKSYSEGNVLTIKSGQTIWIAQSSVLGDTTNIQFIYRELSSSDDRYVTNEDGVIIDAPLLMAARKDFVLENLQVSPDYSGKCLVYKQTSKYFQKIKEYCLAWEKDGVTYYSHKSSEYVSPFTLRNLVFNPTNFSSASSRAGWLSNNPITCPDWQKDGYASNPLSFTLSKKGDYISNIGPTQNRNDLGEFIINEKYIVRVKTKKLEKTETYFTNILPCVKSTDGRHSYLTYNESKDCKVEREDINEKYTLFTWVLVCEQSLSNKEIPSKKPRLYFEAKTGIAEPIYFFECSLFRRHMKDNEIITPDVVGEGYASGYTREYYSYFIQEEMDRANDLDDLIFCDKQYFDDMANSPYTPVYDTTYEKIRSVTASKSNRFNLIQELCETFECWAKFHIGHDARGGQKYWYEPTKDGSFVEGKTYYKPVSAITEKNKNDDYFFNQVFALAEGEKVSSLYERKVEKWISFKEYIGEENWAGFRYGINLKNIQRKIDSQQVVTKMIVQPNSNENAPGGYCTIQAAAANPSGENFIINLNYYIQNGVLDRRAVGLDLYDENVGLGYIPKLYKYNAVTKPLIEQQVNLLNDLTKVQSTQYLYQTYIEEATKTYNDSVEKIRQILSGMEEHKNDDPYTVARNEDEFSDILNKYITSRDEAKATQNKYEALIGPVATEVNELEGQVSSIELTLSKITEKKKALNQSFYDKYSQFIQEGTWISEDYDVPDNYYADACRVSRTSAFPKVIYTIQVLELSQIDEYQNYHFRVGDKTYIEDVEFFGYNSKGQPYKEEVVVSQVVYSLDDPSQNSITVQNYKTQFEDLFQRVAAAVTTLQYAEGQYNRAASIMNEDGTINSAYLKNSLTKNTGLVLSAPNGELVIDQEKGSIAAKSPKGELILNSMGLVIGNDGEYQTAISAEGINASVITTGRLNAGSVNIYTDEQETFRWDAYGLNAYYFEADESGIISSVNYNNFIRMDRFGLYAYQGDTKKIFSTVDEVAKDSLFSLTRNGLRINSDGSGGDVSIKIGEVFSVGKENDKVKLKISGAMEGGTIKIGPKDETKTKWNFEITDEGKLIIGDNFSVDQNGIVTIKNGKIDAGTINAEYNNVLAKAFRVVRNGNTIGYFGPMFGSTGLRVTEGLGFYYDGATEVDSEVITTETGARITAKTRGNEKETEASIYVNTGVATISAPRINIGDSGSTIYVKDKVFEPGVAYFA